MKHNNLEIHKEYNDSLGKISELAKNIALDKTVSTKIDDLLAKMNETQLLVPIIGAFSAGKSSLLNSFLADEILSVRITPETCLATELHFASENSVEAVTNEGVAISYPLNGFDIQQQQPDRYQFLRYHLNNQHLKDISPLILVDMPGFDSPLDAHSRAIMSYLGRAVHFILMVSVEDGTLPRSVLRQLLDLQAVGHSFEFLLSKTNLRPASDVQLVAKEISVQLREQLNYQGALIPIDDKNGGAQLSAILRKINPTQLFKQLFRQQALEVANDVLSNINIRIAALGSEQSENQKVMQELSDKIERVQRKAAEMEEDVKEQASQFNNNMITNALGRELGSSADEIVSLIVGGNQDGAEQLINEIIRSCLLRELQGFLKNAENDAIEGFSVELRGLQDNLAGSGWNQEMVNKLNGFLSGQLSGLLDKVQGNSPQQTADFAKAAYRAITTVTAVTTSILAPVLELLIILLPDILQTFFANKAKARQREEIRQKLLGEVFPSIKSKLRQELPSIIQTQASLLIEKIGNETSSRLASMQAEISKGMAERQSKAETLQQDLEKLSQSRNQVSDLAQTLATC